MKQIKKSKNAIYIDSDNNIYAAYDGVLHAKGMLTIKTDLHVDLSKDYVGYIVNTDLLNPGIKRSQWDSITVRDKLFTRGLLYVTLYNHGKELVQIRAGDRVAKLLILFKPTRCNVVMTNFNEGC